MHPASSVVEHVHDGTLNCLLAGSCSTVEVLHFGVLNDWRRRRMGLKDVAEEWVAAAEEVEGVGAEEDDESAKGSELDVEKTDEADEVERDSTNYE